MIRRTLMIGFNRFFSQSTLSHVSSSKAELENFVLTVVKKPAPAKELAKESELITARALKKPMREMTKEERDKICEQLEEASRHATFY